MMSSTLRATPSTHRRATALGLGALLLTVAPLGALGLPTAAAAGPTFVVTSTGDAPDAGTRRDGVCRTSTNVCTLRAALMEANAASGHATIAFGITGPLPHTIAPGTKLPGLTNPAGITIDGYTQPGALPNTHPSASQATIAVELRGQGPSSFDGLSVTTADNVIRGLALYNFATSLLIYGEAASRNRVVGNYICTNAAGTYTSPSVHTNGLGVLLTKGAAGNAVGGPAAEDRNVVSGCAHRAITLSFYPTIDNRVQNNIIGLNPAGTAALANRAHGVDINYTGNNLVGGDGPGEGNVISGNVGAGIEISHGRNTKYNEVIGNYLGTDVTGDAAPSYARNGQWGVRLEGPKFCGIPDRPYAAGCTEAVVTEGLPHHNVVRDNVIVNNAKGGVLIDKGQHDDTVSGNRIGVLPSGGKAGNGLFGLRFERGAYDNLVQDNVISGNPRGIMVTSMGYYPQGGSGEPTYGNRFTVNSIFGNSGYGIDLAPFGQQNTETVGDEKVHRAIAIPVLVEGTATSVKGRGCAGCAVDVYRADVSKAGVVGEGKTFLGSGTVGATGSFTVTFTSSPGAVVTALVHDDAKGSSEFATSYKLPT
jgi:hypothetical protein